MAMMDRRLELHSKLKAIIQNDNVYFQPPESIKLRYPCIIYTRTRIDSRYADDLSYKSQCEYSITVIDKNPDSEIVAKVLSSLRGTRYDRSYKVDNLNHDVFYTYY